MEKLLNFNEPVDVNLLDRVVAAFYNSANTLERDTAQKVLTQFQENPDSWMRVDTILEYSQNENTKYFALQILDSVIRYKWGILPREQCDGIKKYIVNLIIKLSSDDSTLQSEKLFIGKLNIVLVQIIKKEWPRNWETFIPEIVAASKTNESLCENNMVILRLMSEEVFDFSNGQMTQAKINELKRTLNNEFTIIYQLCEFILEKAQKPSLILATLQTLLRFLNWIPLGYIFETKMIDTLLFKFFPVTIFRNIVLECLTEIACLTAPDYDQQFSRLFSDFMLQLIKIIPHDANIEEAYENGSQEDETFILNISLFLTGFFKNHLTLMENANQGTTLAGHNYLASISLVDNDEIFKICLEYWFKLASELFHENLNSPRGLIFSSTNSLGFATNLNQFQSPRVNLYAKVLSRVRLALIRRMPKPEEVLIVEDENGQIVRETMKDTDATTLYKSMRETLIFLTHLDSEDTQEIMLSKLNAQVDGSEWSWQNLNTLCWAIGAISGAMNEEQEKKFLVTVIKDLLGLVEMKRGKDNKAVIASNIMYIVGNYPRFLRVHWKFLKTVANKLFEFMHETHPGVQDMACDTFLRISQQCRRKFVNTQAEESKPFIEEILSNLPKIIADLEDQQIHTFYEAIGCMIQSEVDPGLRDNLLAKLMELPNQTWTSIMNQAAHNIEALSQPETIKSITNILKTNVRTCSSLGYPFISQIGRIYLDMLNVYKAFSEMISNTIASTGAQSTHTSKIRGMRAVKKESLKLIETFINKAEDLHTISINFIPPLLEAVLGDYRTNIPDARDPEVLSVMATIVNKLKSLITKDIPRILGSVFECTLEMITKNFTDYPEHRLHFFILIRAINQHCFQAFFVLPQASFKLILDSIVWAFKHTERQISETGLNILLELFNNIANAGADISSSFYKTFFLSLLQDVLYVLTDTFHKSGFKLQATILAKMFEMVESGGIREPLWDPSSIQDPSLTNQIYIRKYVSTLLESAFTNLNKSQIENFVHGLFALNKDLLSFKNHLRDFLVQLKEFSGSNEDLYLEEKEAAMKAASDAEVNRALRIPGMVPQNQVSYDMND